MLLASAHDLNPLFGLFSLLLVGALATCLVSLRLRQSLIVGYFLCGILATSSGLHGWLAPHGVDPTELIETFAELGIVLLMFTIGVEFDLSELSHLRRIVRRAGLLQVFGTIALTIPAGLALGLPLAQAAFFGLIVALSSTALAMKGFQDLGMANHPAARAALGVALLQDVLVVFALLLLPGNSHGGEDNPWLRLVSTALRGAIFLGVCALLARFALPWLFKVVTRTRSRELFTLCVAALCIGIAWSASALGLNLALGAFAAGAVISGSIYRHRVLADILPFKDLFLALFFISVGLQIDLADLTARWPLYLASTAAILLGKTVVALLGARLLGLAPKASLYTAFSLASLGEFSLVLFSKGEALAPAWAGFGAWLAACTALTMALVPPLMALAPRLGGRLERLPGFRRRTGDSQKHRIDELESHAIVVGHGPVGQRLRASLEAVDVPVVVVELNADTVRALKKEGVPVLYADIRQPETLALAHAERARALVITFPDPALATAAITAARQINPEIQFFARAKFDSEVEQLRRSDAEGIVHDEIESGYALAREVLTAYSRDDETIDAEVLRLREHQG